MEFFKHNLIRLLLEEFDDINTVTSGRLANLQLYTK